MTTDEAWSLLCETSHLSNRKVVDIARIVMDAHGGVPIEGADLHVAVSLARVLDESVARVRARQLGNTSTSTP